MPPGPTPGGPGSTTPSAQPVAAPPAVVTSPGVEDPAALFNSVLHAAAAQVEAVVKPAAAAAVAVGFTFPLALMLIVLLFLIIQPRMDRRDPKLARRAARTVPFEPEERG